MLSAFYSKFYYLRPIFILHTQLNQ